MLYRTHHPSIFQFPSSATTTTISSSPIRIFLSSLQTEMECVEAALKTSIRKEMGVNQVALEDFWAVNVQNAVSCDDFSVDELLDFSNEDSFVGEEEAEEEEEKACTLSSSSSLQLLQDNTNTVEEEDKKCDNCNNFSSKDDFGPVPATELALPADDLASLEWLSHFVEDSNSEYSTPFPSGASPEKPKMESRSEPEKVAFPTTEPCFKTPVPAKARSKRTRTGVRVWPLGSPSLTESSSSSNTTTSTTTTSTSSSSSPCNPWLIYTNLGGLAEPVSFEKLPAAKKQKKKTVSEGAPPRRCSHCGVTKTPQWRAGPMGAKTLCNACGVRFKSGRLLPEYRPACSPTFSSELHSNHHRKVLEMRKKKDSPLGQAAESGLVPPAVPSF